MSKKKVAKQLGLTAAVAASAVVAANPASAASASTVETAVVQAEKDAIALGKFYRNADLEVSADFSAAYNKAKKSIESAKAQVATLTGSQKSLLSARVAAADANRLKAAYYIDGVKFVQNDLAEATAALAEHVEAGEITDETVEVYNNLSATIRKAERVIGKIYGSEVRTAIESSYLLDAKFAREAVIYEVSQYELMNEIAEQVAAGELTTAADNFKVLERLKVRAVEIKEAGRALYPDRTDVYPDLPSIEDQLRTTETAVVTSYEAKLTPAVESVNVVNATEIQVTFNSSIAKSSVLDANGAILNTAVFKLKELDGQADASVTKATLSADGKTLTLTTDAALSKRYDVEIEGLKGTNDKTLTKYHGVHDFAADKTAPTIVSTTKVSASSFKVKFSEPIKTLGTVSYKLADGSTVPANSVVDNFTAGAQEVTFTLGSGIDAGKEVIGTFIGLQDQAGNLLTPNPASVSFVKGSKDGVAPTVSSITQTGATTFAVKFSEELLTAPTVTIGGQAASKVEKDSKDATVYNVTAGSVLDGAATVVISSFTDLSGQAGTNLSKVVTFVKDTARPKVASSAVVVDATNKKEYLELTFDKDIVLGNLPTVDGVSGSYLKDYVTTSITDQDIPATAISYKSSTDKKVVRVELDTLLANKDVKGAAYTLKLSFANVATAANYTPEDVTVTFTRGEDGVASNTDVVGVSNIQQVNGDNSKIEVTFNKAVDGATATDVANYKIDGAVVESVTLKPAVNNNGTVSQVAVLNIKAGSNAFTGPRNITISGVKALGSSKAMETYFVNNISIKENVAPVITSAKLTGTSEITLTFSEAVSQAATTAADFEVLIGGKSQSTAEKVDSGLTSTAATTVKVTINSIDADELAKGISLKAVDTLDVVDAAGNKLSLPSNIVVSN